MTTYLISYDLCNPGRNYSSLAAAIAEVFPYRIRPLQSVLVVKSDSTAVQIRDFLQQYVDQSDRILVMVVKAPAAWVNLINHPDSTNWLNTNLN